MPRIAVSIKAESRYCASGMTVQNRPEYSYECTNEGIFIACMGLSKRATCITEENIGYYLQNIDNVKLDSNIICDMVKNMMKRPYEGNYLK